MRHLEGGRDEGGKGGVNFCFFLFSRVILGPIHISDDHPIVNSTVCILVSGIKIHI